MALISTRYQRPETTFKGNETLSGSKLFCLPSEKGPSLKGKNTMFKYLVNKKKPHLRTVDKFYMS